MRKPLVLLVALALTLTACSRPKPASSVVEPETPPAAAPNPNSAPAPAPAALPEGPDLMALPGPFDLTIDQLRQGLVRYLSRGEGSVAERLNALFDHWQLRVGENHVRLAEADLDGDGRNEVVTALNVSGGLTGTGQVYVIREQDGKIAVESLSLDPVPGANLFALADLTGDGAPEIIWTSTQVGAHTAHTQVYVSRWRPGGAETLPGEITMASAKVERDGTDLVLTGGLIGSVGAGPGQRSRVDRYRWTGERFDLVDQRYAGSSLRYHRLIDGIVAETFGHKSEAEGHFREAMTEESANLAGLVEPEQVPAFTAAVRTFARFRLGALLLAEGEREQAFQVLNGETGPYAELLALMARAADREVGCKAATDWAAANPGFIEALNSPAGYANPVWQPEDLCGKLPLTTP